MVRPRSLICGVVIALVALSFSGCTTPAKTDSRDPDVWRPTAPAAYPLPTLYDQP